MALVNVHEYDTSSTRVSNANPTSRSEPQDDPDMQRVTDLMDLHYGVKISHMEGEDAGLRQARRDIEKVLQKLEGRSNENSVRTT